MKISLLFLAAALFLPLAAFAQTAGLLRVHPENPRYFSGASRKAILLTGSHTWPNFVDMGPTDPPAAFDFDAYLKWLKAHGHNFTRGWTWEPTRWDTSAMKNSLRQITAGRSARSLTLFVGSTPSMSRNVHNQSR